MPDSAEAQSLKSPTSPNRRPEVCGPHAPERPYPIYLRGKVEKGFGRGSKDLGCPTANLPARVVGPGSSLTRTGVYFGFARVLPQDPDDPTLTDSEDNELTVSTANIDDEDDEVVLGASPIGEGGQGFLDSQLPRSRNGSRGQPSPASVLEAAPSRPDKEWDVSRQELLSNGAASAHGTSASTSSTSTLTSVRSKKTKRVHLEREDSQVYPMVMSVGWNPFYKNTHKTAEVHILHDFASDFYGLEIRVVVLGYVRPEYNYDSMGKFLNHRHKAATIRRQALRAAAD
ncbi:hypothetical protein PHSY_005678 [Pseudozyma hubeiensis SY62]|uniref:Riboflavin kinase n=1 Tax=Pseudozyma hubeiensis (strain SY62) TaxID=1305764 RepID=R9P9R1_PSEHS|nr:hypothetical protein PHSY_005678 [Pseudozyma hubeiensis SY62]GAC98089.1 hypothetical protein PHSY_005678 [Pseudozyma hubeiensis SY62]